jgi:hypothetical protein
MKWRPRWSTVTIALAVIAALAIASPVLGISKSIKKAIKREVARQIANATGPAGPAGSNGAQGPKGTAGHDGAAVTARVRSTGSVDTPADHSHISVPLGASTWTQAPGELDLGPYGRFTYTAPAAGSCGGAGYADLIVNVNVDGVAFSFTQVQTIPNGATHSGRFDATKYLFEAAAAVAHTATAEVSGVCESGNFPAVFTVSDLRFDIVRAS